MGKYTERLVAPQQATPATPSQRLTSPTAPTAEPATGPRLGKDSVASVVDEQAKFGAGMGANFARGVENLGEGAYQMTLDMAENMGIVDKGTANEWTRLTNEERAAVDKELKSKFGDGFGFMVARGSGEFLPTLLIPGMGKTAVARIGGAMAGGAASGAMGYQPSEDLNQRNSDRMFQAGIGTALGGTVGAGMEGLYALKNIIPKAIETVKKLKGDFIAEGIDVSKRTGILFKLSQLTDDPMIENIERLARENVGSERVARKLEDQQPAQALKYFESLAGSEGKDFGARVERTFQNVMGDEKAGTGLLGKRKTMADADFAKAKAEGGKIFMSNTLAAIKKLISDLDVPGAGGTDLQMVKELREMETSLMTGGWGDSIRASNMKMGGSNGMTSGGVLNPMQLQKNLERWGQAAKGTGKLFTDKVDRSAEKGPAKFLFTALNRDLDAAIEEGGTGAAALRSARDNFANNTAAITQVRETVLGKLFGGMEAPTVEQIESKFLKMAPTEIKATMRVLNQADPRSEQALQSFWLTRQIEKARIPGQAGAVEFVPAKLLDMVNGGAGPKAAVSNREVFEAVFTDPTMKEAVKTGLAAVQRIMINNARTSGRTVSRMRNIMHVLATRDVGFASRLATELFTPKFVTKYVLDPNGVQALSTLSKPFNDTQAAAALATLANIAMRGEPPQQQQQPAEAPAQP